MPDGDALVECVPNVSEGRAAAAIAALAAAIRGVPGVPLLLVDADGELLGEAPVRGVADIDDLDSLGLSGCRQ